MGRVITMPTEWEFPPGPVRDFAQALYNWYKAAGRPSLTEIAGDIANHGALRGSASRETIRKMLRGETVPQRWSTVEAVLTVLCERAGTSPQGEPEYSEITHGQRVKRLWDDAVEVAHRTPAPVAPEPWADSWTQKDEAKNGKSAPVPVPTSTIADVEAQPATEDTEMIHTADTERASAVASDSGERSSGLSPQTTRSRPEAWPTASEVPAQVWRPGDPGPDQAPEQKDPFQDWQPGTEWQEAIEKSRFPDETRF
ncbi:hypothetical protein [Streptomyces enissocaesilis]|uniref:Uncharacterized protein n=1 Tax=Streptomyces enissocaesilis TaxID=332589 RepID=A0ABP6JN00_9ACTN